MITFEPHNSIQPQHIIKVATYNIHKGFSHFNRRMMVHELRERLRNLNADIVFLQEVVGEHDRHARCYPAWPAEPQYEFLAESVWGEFAYGRNAVYDQGHHGNAILSRYAILRAENQDVSAHAYEKRGLLHCEIDIPGAAQPLHCVCVHLALHERGRRQQIGALVERLLREVPGGAPVIVAGDFNDWRNLAGRRLSTELGLSEASATIAARPCAVSPLRFRYCDWIESTFAVSRCDIPRCIMATRGRASPITPRCRPSWH